MGFLAALATVASASALPAGEWPARPWNFLGLMAAERQFVRAGTSGRPFTEPVVLVSDGSFRRSRNPMYLGLILALVGAALLLSSSLALLAAPAYGWWVQRRFLHVRRWV